MLVAFTDAPLAISISSALLCPPCAAAWSGVHRICRCGPDSFIIDISTHTNNFEFKF